MPPNPNSKRTSLSSILLFISNYFKPHRAEALLRIRINAFCFLLIFLLTALLPLPSLPTALRTVMTMHNVERWSSEWVHEWVCIFEVAAMSIFGFNVLEGLYAVKYPRAPLPPLASPSKAKGIYMSPPAPQRPFKSLSPKTSPQPQKSFSFSTSTSFSPFPASTSPPTTYPTSPISTPSRVLHYTIPPSSSISSSTTTLASTTSPSPVLSAYRGKHSNAVGRAFDGSFLNRLLADESDAED